MTKTQFLCGFSFFSWIFKSLQNWKFAETVICNSNFLSIHKPSWSHVRFNTKFRPDRFSRFDVYWIRTDRQTDKQLKITNLRPVYPEILDNNEISFTEEVCNNILPKKVKLEYTKYKKDLVFYEKTKEIREEKHILCNKK